MIASAQRKVYMLTKTRGHESQIAYQASKFDATNVCASRVPMLHEFCLLYASRAKFPKQFYAI